jgi:hypothetical protein
LTLSELHAWIVSPEGLGGDIATLRRWAAIRALGASGLKPADDLSAFAPDWPRLLLAASALGASNAFDQLEAALMIAQAAVQFAVEPDVQDGGALVLSQLANHRALALALQRGVVQGNFEGRLGVGEQLNQARRELQQTIFLRAPRPTPAESGDVAVRSLTASVFQRELWDRLIDNAWVSATAPTAAGKTYLVLQWLVERFAAGDARLAVFIAPTRALVAEIERALLDLAVELRLPELRVGSLPIAVLGDETRPTILVFTQERLQVFLNAVHEDVRIDIAIFDEVHKVADGTRGVILQDAIERLARANRHAHFVFLSPLAENPQLLVEDAPDPAASAVVPSQTPTVTQNVILAEQAPRNAKHWTLALRQEGELYPLGKIELHAKPDRTRKRISYLALALGRTGSGTLIYANDANEAEQIASQIFDGLATDFGEGVEVPQELIDLADFARDTIHPDFALVEFARRGVAFHYGNMPSLLRLEIERLFKSGAIRFLVCTSTLVEGVNLACQTIIVRGPRKGQSAKMAPHDFWNLAGRAGRWGQDFQGNIVCVDPTDTTAWPNGVPRRARYTIVRKTQDVLGRREELLEFLRRRPEMREAIDAELEQVAAYLLAWRLRRGPIAGAPVAAALDREYVEELDAELSAALARIDVSQEVVLRHVGVSAFAMQTLLEYFREPRENLESLLPPSPESRDARDQLIAIFTRIHNHMFPAFVPLGRVAVQALTTVNWMRGYPLARMIRERLQWLADHNQAIPAARAIRDTMKDVEEIARFKAPKYLSAYLDVLRQFLDEKERLDLFDDRLDLELYLEFGVGTLTQISMIGLGLSRTSAVELNEWLGDDSLDEAAVLQRLRTRRWEGLNIPNVVKREIGEVLARRNALAA